MNELVSVIVPIFNVEKYLARCINSLINQTYKNIEIILVDDGSPDDSGAICDSFAARDKRITVIHKENAGLGLARNSGLEIAHGHYVMFVDSDDYIALDTIEKCVNKCDETDAEAVFFGKTDVFDDGTEKVAPVLADKLCFSGTEEVHDFLRGLFIYERGHGISVWGALFDLDLMRENDIVFRSERELLSEDAFFLIELFAHMSRVSVLDDNLYFYYQNGQSISKRHNPGHQLRCNSFLNESVKRCGELGYPQSILDYVYVRYHIYTLSGMKRILRSGLPKKEKRKELKKVFTDSVLRTSFTKGSLGREGLSLRIFWAALRARLYIFCYLFLLYKIKR